MFINKNKIKNWKHEYRDGVWRFYGEDITIFLSGVEYPEYEDAVTEALNVYKSTGR